MPSTKRKAADAIHPSRKLRRLSDGSSQSSRSSSPTSDSEDSPPAAKTFEADSEEDEDNAPATIVFDDLPERIRIKPKQPIPPKTAALELPTSPSTTDFEELGISPTLVRALKTMSIRKPTPVQAACIPPLLAGQDCIGNAKTGSGKTIAFALPILQKLASDPYGIFALVLTPTRELAFQISEQFAVLGSTMNVQTTVVVGGMDMMAQAIELRARPHVVIATPGRLVDLMSSGSGEWNLSRVRFLVLDEADRLLTSTFAADLKTIFAAIPNERQTGLFTATITPTIENLAISTPRPGKLKPVMYRDVSTVETVETLKQFFFLVPSHVREVYLYHLLCNPPDSILHLRREPPLTGKALLQAEKRQARQQKNNSSSVVDDAEDPDAPPKQPPPTIIFVRHPKTAAYLTTLLQHLEIRTTALHSHLSQPQRLASLQLFRASVVPVLVCTDVASRGLDMDGVGLVINWDMPIGKPKSGSSASSSGSKALANGGSGKGEGSAAGEGDDDVGGAEEYVHRVGRTARMGRGGVAISFITERPEDAEMVQKIEDRIRTKLVEYTMPEEKVLEKLNLVSTAKRTAKMEVNESDFGKRHEINRTKRKKLAAGSNSR
ncbi:DEAD-domain-containing protein [Clavulina sp. PMI_390]|nr:DEAD-domain-containing protein [Clavulina sp. PMI_390]